MFANTDRLDSYTQRLIRFQGRKLCRMMGCDKSQSEDVVQELHVQVWQAIARRDAADLWTKRFAALIVRNEAISIQRKYLALKRGGGLVSFSLNEPVPDDDQETCSRAETICFHARKKALKDSALSRASGCLDVLPFALSQLPPHLRELCEHLKCMTPHAAAKALNISYGQVVEWILEIRRRFENAGIEKIF